MGGVYFIHAQGYEVTKNILMQDNKSTILLAKKGRFSSFKTIKHIKNRYSMIKDKIGKGLIVIQYFPTGDIWSDIFTKDLQVILLYKMRDCLMGIGEDYDNDIERLNTHPDVLPSHECADNFLAEDSSVLAKQEILLKFSRLLRMHCQIPPRKLKLPWHICYLLEQWQDKHERHHHIVGVC